VGSRLSPALIVLELLADQSLSGVHDSFSKFFAGFETRDVSRRQGDGFAGLGVSSDAWWTVTQGKTTEATDFDSTTGGQSFSHVIKHSGYTDLNVSMCKMRLMACESFNKF
jgi:hypothetical protein